MRKFTGSFKLPLRQPVETGNAGFVINSKPSNRYIENICLMHRPPMTAP